LHYAALHLKPRREGPKKRVLSKRKRRTPGEGRKGLTPCYARVGPGQSHRIDGMREAQGELASLLDQKIILDSEDHGMPRKGGGSEGSITRMKSVNSGQHAHGGEKTKDACENRRGIS